MVKTIRMALLAAAAFAAPMGLPLPPLGAASAQTIGFKTPEQVRHETAYWTGERFADGRPKVSDSILARMKRVTLEEAWAALAMAGFNSQFEDGWIAQYPDKVLVGRALTSTWVPGRPDLQKIVEDDGRAAGRRGGANSWPVEMLGKDDVYVSDHFGLKKDGPSVGDNVANAIYARTGTGIVYDGALRDVNGLRALENFTSFYRSYDPSHHRGALSEGARLNSTMTAINAPTRIGRITVMPGDVILGRDGGIIAIPPQLAERVVKDSERTHLRDVFGHQRLREGKYTAGQIDTAIWTPEIEADYDVWLKENVDKLTTIGRAEIEAIIAERAQPRPPRPARPAPAQ